ncbi:MAG: hypothetical protein ACFFDN_45355 [Candidatus Hodarchaeota archaeon]
MDIFNKIYKKYGIEKRMNQVKDSIISSMPFLIPKGYTDHSLGHIYEIFKNLETVLGFEGLTKLNDVEIFLLSTSIWLHDIGRMVNRKDTEIDDHAKIGSKIIEKEFTRFGLNYGEGFYISQICKMHNLPNSELKHLPNNVIVNNKKVRFSLLCFLLRIGDILDIRSDRAPELVSKYSEISPSSMKHWKKHQGFTGFAFDKENGILEIGAIVSSHLQFRMIKNAIQSIESEFESAREFLQELGIFIRLVTDNITSNEIFKDEEREQSLLESATLLYNERKVYMTNSTLSILKNYSNSLDFSEKSKICILASSLKLGQDIFYWKSCFEENFSELSKEILKIDDEVIQYNYLIHIKPKLDKELIEHYLQTKFSSIKIYLIKELDTNIFLKLLNKFFRDDDPYVRRATILRLKSLDLVTPQIKNLLLNGIKDPHPDVREITARVIISLHITELKKTLEGLLNDRFGRIRMLVRNGLKKWKEDL